jgi:hypothetical protein
MKRFFVILIIILSVLVLAALSLVGFFYWQNKKAQKTETQVRAGIKTFESKLYQFKVDYPEELYFYPLSADKSLPTNFRLATFSDAKNPPADYSATNFLISESNDINMLKEIGDYARIKELEGLGYKKESSSLGGLPAVKLSNSENLPNIVTYLFAKKENRIFEIDFFVSSAKALEKGREKFEKTIAGFSFIQEKQAKNLCSRALAASTCDILDQYYAPSTVIHSEETPTAVINGQTFKPTKNTVCKIEVEVENAIAGSMTVWLYKGTQNLAQKNFNVVNGWNSMVLDSPVSVTPEAEYIIYLNSNSGTADWKGGETGSGGTYGRGHAIIHGYDENDFDFHFREYASSGATTTPTPSRTPRPTGSGTPLPSTQQLTPSETQAPNVPLNLRIWELCLTGITESYIDLEWDQVGSEDLGGYLLYYGKESGNYNYLIDNGTANKIRVEGLLPGEKYFFVVKAYDKSGNLSGPSNEVEANLIKKIKSSYWWIFALLAALLFAAIIAFIITSRKKQKLSLSENNPSPMS